MYQSTYFRPALLELSLPPPQSYYNIDKWRELSAATTSTHNYSLVSRSKDGLQTPPADDMSTTFSDQQFNSYFLGDTALGGASRPIDGGVNSISCVSNRDGLMINLPQTHHSNSGNEPYENQMTHFLPSQMPLHHSPMADALHALDDVQYRDHYQQQLKHQQQQQRQRQQQLKQQRQRRQQHSHKHRQSSSRSKSISSDVNRVKLQIPDTISPEGGSLADFAAEITCLFWFESIDTLNEAEGLVSSSSIRILRPEALPSAAFKKWVATVLSTTQVTDKVIILALLFIYRLKKYNSTVRGRSGSEYRLLTVALMLANKFLDDNTYTNNTWAEVSGISVQDIHVMEVEFLSNMRYSLVASENQWMEWHEKLAKFKQYCDAATRAASIPYSLPPMLSPPESTRASPPPPLNLYKYSQTHLDGASGKCSRYTSKFPPTTAACSVLQPVTTYPRKRSLDRDLEECKKYNMWKFKRRVQVI